ncbi:MAG: protein translocase subunit SecD [Rhodospirillales bacterium]|nr:protein translocase subunit SecD [Rhodospirillales bacterium]
MHFERWKVLVILAVCIAGAVFATPNLLSRQQAENLPGWLQPVNLGLDLQGGSHLLLEVEVGTVLKERLTSLVDSARIELRKERIRYVDLGVDGNAMTVRIIESGDRAKARDLLRGLDRDTEIDERADGLMVVTYTQAALTQQRNAAIDQSIEIVRRRVDELGTREPTIQRQGEDRILVQLPGVDDPERIKTLLGKTAKLTFHMVDDSASVIDAQRGRVPPGSVLIEAADPQAGEAATYVVRRRVTVGGDSLVDAQPSFQNNEPVVSFRFDSAGAKRFGDATKENVGRQLAILLDDRVISAPVIREPILGGSGIISGNFTVQSANDLALLLRAGALPAPLVILEERTVGPDLGADSIRAGAIACVIGLVLVIIFMVLTYGLFGVFANLALAINLVLLLGGLSALGATLTLPGIAGIVLTMGMAVDANVLIYERMREEARVGRSVINALQAGFDRAIVTILDSQLTTLIAALLLFQFGSGPIRGFAVTLTLGLITSMFTAVWLTRLIISLWLARARPKALPI